MKKGERVTPEQVLEALTTCVAPEGLAHEAEDLRDRLSELGEVLYDEGDSHGGTLLYELAAAVDRYLRWRHWELTGG